ncbi:DGQHR domain-containing protein [Algoriphagus halophilus]|uniref:DNA sulfur modification protein DndB n=1 Tax=Algoriphagus halophilus TaxID=226505 RepID=A0A1N6DTZ1_9BACT|nr:DGQHR domain-containing protein [Algoriphagus halophilus]SIN74266.1 DNA sulfur modification protein DndB [Algoriphagus halophilus]
MSLLKQIDIDQVKSKLTDDLSQLGKIYKSKRNANLTLSVDHNLVDGYLKEGWEIQKELKTKTRLIKPKSHSKKFEDDVWCQLYELGYRYLNYDDSFKLPYGKEPEDLKQIDVIAIDKETVILIECKSSEKPRKSTSLKTEFEGLEKRLDGFRKSIDQIFGRGLKVKYIYATRKIRIDEESIEIGRLLKTNSYYYNDNTFGYINSLIKNYKDAAHYQFLGMLYKDQLISSEKIEVPAIEGTMGKKTYFMFSLEPHILLKMGFVLHRTRANESEMPTYQRLLVPNRLKDITKFINEGGYFPNSVIVNFTERKHKIHFEGSSRSGDSRSRYGMLKIPNAYAIAYIIDGQHRLYGYANSDFKLSNTIPVVAFSKLDSTEQLEIFMDINENQKAVSADLRLTLEEDLYWDSDRADSRIKALRSAIINELSNSVNAPLYNKVSIGEDKGMLSSKPIATALLKSGLLPSARGNKYNAETSQACLYDIHNHSHGVEMRRAKKNVVQFLNLCYSYIEEEYPDIFEREQYFILSNRGSYAFINLIGSLNYYETVETKNLNLKSTPAERFGTLKPYFDILINGLRNLPEGEEDQLLSKYGTGADVLWFRTFQTIINNSVHDYEPPALIDWKERQDKDLQDRGREFVIEIEKYMKHTVLGKTHQLFGDNWELEINSIKRECLKRAEEENEKNYKEGLKNTNNHWTEMFHINDYKSIILKYWTKKDETDPAFKTFEEEFSFDIGTGFNSKSEKTKWISHFNSLRNLSAHEGTKEKGLNREEVQFLENLFDSIVVKQNS